MWHERTTEHIHHRSLPSVRNFSMPGTGNENRRIPGSYVRLRRRHYPVYKDTHRLYFQTSQIQEQETVEYNRLVYNVKKVLPISKEINRAVIETYEYMITLPDEKSRQKHMKAVEKSLKEQYTPRMKKLSFSQGKLLIKLVDRQTNSTGYELVKAFMGPFKAGFYQTFAALFGASLKKQYDPTGDDALTERVILLVESGQL